MHQYSTRVFTSDDDLARLAPDWIRCLEQQPRPQVEQHPDWLLSEARRQQPAGRMVVVLYDRGDVVGVAPFLLRRFAWACRLGYASVAQFPMELADLCGESLIAPPDPAAHEALFDALDGAAVPFEMVFLESVPVGSPLWRLVELSAERNRFWAYRAGGVSTHRLLEIPDSFAAYLGQHSGKTRRTLEYKVRQLEKACPGRLRLERVTSADQVPALLERCAEISSRSWQGTRMGRKIEGGDTEQAFYRDQAERGWLRSYVLLDGQRPIAFAIGLQAYGTYYYDEVGYDPEYAAQRPGTALLYKLLEDLCREHRPDVLDFRHGDSEYKKLFSNRHYDEANWYLLRKSAYTAVARAARAGLDRVGLRERARHALRGHPSALVERRPTSGAKRAA
jgi:CelD/BcsL family acetyltransferase involved in cellulose biosynthesis